MELLNRKLEDDHNNIIFGDQHRGAALSSKGGWKEMVEVVHSKIDGCKNNYCTDVGDQMEAIMIDDKRYSTDTLTQDRPLQQMDDCIEDRKPIKDKLLFMLDGNHPDKLWRFGDLVKRMSKKLEVPYGTWTTKFSVLDKRGNLMYKLFATHGKKLFNSVADDKTRREANIQLSLKRFLKFKAGDCAVMVCGHAHKLIVTPPIPELFLTDDGERIKQNYTSWGQNEPYIDPDARWYGCSGSFLKLYGIGDSGYGEKAGYNPTEIGFLILKVRDRKIIGLDKYKLDI